MCKHRLRQWLFAVLTLLLSTSSRSANITVDSISGVVSGDRIVAGTDVSIYLRLYNDFPDTIFQIFDAFRVYSPDGAQWYPHAFVDTNISFNRDLVFDTTFYGHWTDTSALNDIVWWKYFDDYQVHAFWGFNLGEVSDTVQFWAIENTAPGLVPGQTMIPWLIEIDSVSAASIGKTLCFDTCGFPTGPSVWFNGGEHFPTWDGPYCFEIVDCCEGMRGNINLDQSDDIDISDLTALVGWMFKSGAAPLCMLEADVDGNSSHDIADVTYLVGYMFKSGPEPAGCP